MSFSLSDSVFGDPPSPRLPIHKTLPVAGHYPICKASASRAIAGYVALQLAVLLFLK
jgi:hypothetical protein